MAPFEPLTQTNARTLLAHRRLAARLTQRQMWEALGVSKANYVRLEQGRLVNPPLRLLQNCAIALGCKLDDIIEPEWREWYTPEGYEITQPPKFKKE